MGLKEDGGRAKVEGGRAKGGGGGREGGAKGGKGWKRAGKWREIQKMAGNLKQVACVFWCDPQLGDEGKV